MLKTEFVANSCSYRQIDKEEVIFYIEGHFTIFVISKELQRSSLKRTKHMADIIPEGMLFPSKEDGYPDFLDAMKHYFNNSGLQQNDFQKCNYFVVKRFK